MYQFPIGVMVDSFCCEMHEAIRRTAGIGALVLQMYATRRNYSPENLTPTACRELLDFVKSHGLVFSVCAETRARGEWTLITISRRWTRWAIGAF